ncbi:MAG: LptE family protein [Akkermansiaceae bacterium]|nr:LptE family protein [Akkermansiaceae bacterium]
MSKLVIILCLFLVSCAGYQLGGSKPSNLSHVKSIHIPLFQNDTLFVRAETQATNSVVDALNRDGTYQIASSESADAILKGRITDLDYGQVSSIRTDSLRSEELSLTIHIDWSLVDASNPSRILVKGRSTGRTTFFARGNLNIARTNALPDALQRACESLSSRLADGF